ncbi:methyl-accepting chemotaxis protein [Melioribacteraceae bacterium 4301-Me]|uniref:methyl-accepting chemotaxis protein n=1 Tax=Pyranulibacter aquaticus TaxID=3163344 RepID=UPI00359B052E
MRWFLNLSTRNKLYIAFAVIIILIGIIAITTYSNIENMRISQKVLYENDFVLVNNLPELRSSFNRARVLILTMMLVNDPQLQKEFKHEVDLKEKSLDSLLTIATELNSNDAVSLSKIDELKSLLTEFRKTRQQILDLLSVKKYDEAQKLATGIQSTRYDRIRKLTIELEKSAKNDAELSIKNFYANIKAIFNALTIISIISILLAIAITLYLSKIIASPLKEITNATNKISSGDLTITIPHKLRKDEIGFLSDNFTQMLQNLRSITKEITEGINVLGSSASEILATTTQIASAAAQTASSISQTTTTVEEVKQTAQLSSQKAKYVLESSQRASQFSQTGKKSVEESIEAMNKIKEQMEFVAEGIVRLSEQSQAIGEIIAAVNDLADQSNLLAVNAAIEAAKAGEQGKGFSVVAQEIRSLAEQSKQATTQVRTILGEIQKAMSSAVLATEQAAKAVEAGVKQSLEAGESIRVLTESVTEAAQAATQIAASSQQQFVGMEQIAQAMENIKQASSQNAVGTKQAESAAKNLNELGTKLKELVQQFKV